MESHKERKEQLEMNKERDKQDQKTIDGVKNKIMESQEGCVVDPALKALIREAILSGDQERSITQDPDQVLAFARSVNKIDSSLE